MVSFRSPARLLPAAATTSIRCATSSSARTGIGTCEVLRYSRPVTLNNCRLWRRTIFSEPRRKSSETLHRGSSEIPSPIFTNSLMESAWSFCITTLGSNPIATRLRMADSITTLRWYRMKGREESSAAVATPRPAAGSPGGTTNTNSYRQSGSCTRPVPSTGRFIRMRSTLPPYRSSKSVSSFPVISRSSTLGCREMNARSRWGTMETLMWGPHPRYKDPPCAPPSSLTAPMASSCTRIRRRLYSIINRPAGVKTSFRPARSYSFSPNSASS